MAKTREQLNAEAIEAGIANPTDFGTIAELQAAIDRTTRTNTPDTPVETVAATVEGVQTYLADPITNRLPEGVVINFGDPDPIRFEG